MSSHKLSANRRNAQRSTGPRTSTGKSRSKENSFKHGLSLKMQPSSALNSQIENLAAALAAPVPNPIRLHFAMIAAKAEIELLRIAAVRTLINSRYPDTQSCESIHDLARLERTNNGLIREEIGRFVCFDAW
jgi:hypothetical protein